MDFNSLLMLMLHQNASDMFITAGKPPCIKVEGRLKDLSKKPISKTQAGEIIESIMTQKQRDEFANTKACNFALSGVDIGRFRVSAFMQRDSPGMVLRQIAMGIPTIQELHLPPILNQLAMSKRGLIIFVGATGTGKSSSLAALIKHRNQNSSGHIITVEDPLEFIHSHEGCMPIRLAQADILRYDPVHDRLPSNSVGVSASLP